MNAGASSAVVSYDCPAHEPRGIDLSKTNADKLQKAIGPYLRRPSGSVGARAARPVPRPQVARPIPRRPALGPHPTALSSRITAGYPPT